jgi:hypothetical protein
MNVNRLFIEMIAKGGERMWRFRRLPEKQWPTELSDYLFLLS